MYAIKNNLNVKKINDQARLTPNWIKYILRISSVSLNTKYDDTPIKI